MMHMAADSNMNFHHGVFPSSFCHQHVDSFQAGAGDSASGLVQERINSVSGISGAAGTRLGGSPDFLNNTSPMMLGGNSHVNLHMEPIAGLKHDTGLAADWSYKELALLKHGVIKYANQPSILKYIKIAALLPEKSVRDVALRCQWMSKKENSNKRHRLEEYYSGKNCRDRKEKMVEYSTKVDMHPFGNMLGYPFMMHQTNHNNQAFSEVPIIDNISQQLLEENAQVLNQIAVNIETFKVQDNVNLFLRTRKNISAILNSMGGMPGIMSRMPPLPVTISEDLVSSILPSTSHAFPFTSTGITVKQEQRH